MLKLFKRIFFVICGLILSNGIVSAQSLSLPYFCGFEDEKENEQWKVIQAKVGLNKWYIGSTLDASLGTRSLAVSSDGGATMTYVKEHYGTISAYRVFTLEPGTYELSFDYKAGGYNKGKSLADGVFVCLQPDTGKFTVSYNNVSIPEWVTRGEIGNFTKGLTWSSKHYTFTINTRGNYRLSFVWRNEDVGTSGLSAAVDNIQIGKAECSSPKEIKHAFLGNSQLVLSWQGSAEKYEVFYKHYESDQVEKLGETSLTSYTVYNLENSVYGFWVRSICGNDTSIWSMYKYIMVYQPEGCINYIDFDNKNVKAYHGKFKNPQDTLGVVDYGFAVDSSRHTIHYLPDEYDPRTGYALKTVPEGKVASVRLGNWLTGSHAEALEYIYTVPEDAGILLLQYAVVLENPAHDEAAQPRFTLRMTDKRGISIENACGDADFIPGKNTEEWHKYGAVEWKDWTYVGINLEKYIGEEIHIILTTYDCNQTGHYGYAYFTIDCIDAAFTGLSCANYKSDTVWGPMGFRYEWYKLSDYVNNNFKNCISTERYFCPDPADTSSYVLRNYFLGEDLDDCRFDMKMSLVPRWPEARASYVVNKYDCKNVVTFRNNSYVRTEQGKSDQKISEFYWDFGNGKTSTVRNPTIIYDQGGTYTVKLYASLSNGLCEDSTIFTLKLDSLYPVTHEFSDYFCEGSYYTFNGEPIFEVGDILDTLKTDCGCDSTVLLHLSQQPKYNITVTDTVCEGTPYKFGDENIFSTGEYKKRFKSHCGCDSIVNLSLEVAEQVVMDMGEVPEVCADQTSTQLNAVLQKGQYDSYKVLFDDKAHAAGFVDQLHEATPFSPVTIDLPTDVKADIYSGHIVFEKRLCDPQTFPFTFKVLYPSSIMAQKWDDVVAVKNAQYNGGYDFVAFRWFKNGVLQEGQTYSYIYEGEPQQEGTEYVVEVQRADGVVLESCPLIIQPKPQSLNAYPSKVARKEKVMVEGAENATYQVWNMMGGIEKEGVIREAKSAIQLSERPGVYLLHVQTDTERKTFRIIVE